MLPTTAALIIVVFLVALLIIQLLLSHVTAITIATIYSYQYNPQVTVEAVVTLKALHFTFRIPLLSGKVYITQYLPSGNVSWELPYTGGTIDLRSVSIHPQKSMLMVYIAWEKRLPTGHLVRYNTAPVYAQTIYHGGQQ